MEVEDEPRNRPARTLHADLRGRLGLGGLTDLPGTGADRRARAGAGPGSPVGERIRARKDRPVAEPSPRRRRQDLRSALRTSPDSPPNVTRPYLRATTRPRASST